MPDTLGNVKSDPSGLSLIIHTYLYCTRLEAWPCRKYCPPLPDLLSLHLTRETNSRLFTQPSSRAPQTSSSFSSIYRHPFSCCEGIAMCGLIHEVPPLSLIALDSCSLHLTATLRPCLQDSTFSVTFHQLSVHWAVTMSAPLC